MTESSVICKLRKTGFYFLCVINLVACGGSSESIEGKYEDYNDVFLSALVIEGFDIGFEADKAGPYYLTAPEDNGKLNFRAEFNDKNENLELYYQIKVGSEASDSIEIESGEQVEVSLQDGASLLEIKLYEMETGVSMTYSIVVEKEPVLGQLAMLNLYYGEEALSLRPAFDPEIYEYEAEVSYATCSYGFRFNSVGRHNQVRLVESGNERLKNLEYYQANLEPGVNYLDLDISNYKGEGERRYSVTIHRQTADEEQENKNANLKGLEIEGKELDFYCGQGVYVIEVNRNSRQLIVRARPEVRGVGLFYGDNDFRSDEDFEITIEENTQSFALRAVSLDGSVSRYYQIYLNRLATNRHYVSTAVELKNALLNAQANDEIVLQAGDYLAGEDLSPDSPGEASYFSSLRSGSALAPIILRSEDEDNPARIVGKGGEHLLSLQGEYWRIENIEFANAKSAITLEGSHQITVENIKTSDMQNHAIQLSGASNITIKDSGFYAGNSDVSQQAQIVISSDVAAEATNLLISRNIFESDGRYPGLISDGNASGLTIEANVFRNIETRESISPQLQIASRDSQVRFNHFYPGEPGEAPVSLSGSGITIYENILERHETSTVLAQANSGSNINAAENFMAWLSYDEDISEHKEVNYSGPLITVHEQLNPRFTIHPLERPDLCLGLVEHESVDDYFYPVLQVCEEAESRNWQFKVASERYVYLKNPDVDEGYLMLPPDFYNYCETLSENTQGAFLYDNLLGFAQQWAIEYYEDGIQLANKFNTDWVLSVGGGTYTPGNRMVGCPNITHERQVFILQETVRSQ